MATRQGKRMSEPSEFSGRTVDEAVEQGLQALGLTRDEAYIEVLQHPRRKFLGRVDALVRIEPRSEDWEDIEGLEDMPQQEVVGQPEPSSEIPADFAGDTETTPEENETDKVPSRARSDADTDTDLAYDTSVPTPSGQEENEEIAVRTLSRLLDCMNFDAYTVERAWSVTQQEQPVLTLHIVGEQLGRLIGRHGNTLQSLQFILRLMLNRQLQEWPSLNIDVDGYQLKQHASLKRRALRIAHDVVAKGRPYTMEAMSAANRRIVHLALQDHPDVYTESQGTGVQRKVIIYLR